MESIEALRERHKTLSAELAEVGSLLRADQREQVLKEIAPLAEAYELALKGRKALERYLSGDFEEHSILPQAQAKVAQAKAALLNKVDEQWGDRDYWVEWLKSRALTNAH